jgi:hypothetical protein
MKITQKQLKRLILEVLQEAISQRQFGFMKKLKTPTQNSKNPFKRKSTG